MKSNQYLSLAFKLFLFILVVFMLDFIFGSIIEYFYYHHDASRFTKTTYMMNDATEDIIIMGDSRAEHVYNTDILGDSLKMTCYNAGSDGQSIFYYKALQDALYTRYTPKIIILEFEGYKLEHIQQHYDRIAYLAPYYWTHKEIRYVVDLKGRLEKFKLISKLYSFNSSIPIIAKGIINPKSYHNGFNPHHGIMDPEEFEGVEYPEGGGDMDPQAVKFFEAFIKDANKYGTKLYIAISPWYQGREYTNKSHHVMMEIANTYDIPVFDYSSCLDYLSENHIYFQDPAHINSEGADKYSKVLAERICQEFD